MSQSLGDRVRILDCPHPFNGMMIVRVAGAGGATSDGSGNSDRSDPSDKSDESAFPEARAADSPTPPPPAAPAPHWRLVLFADRPSGGCDVISHAPVRFCPLCAQPLTRRTPTRSYVAGVNVPVDEHLAGVGRA